MAATNGNGNLSQSCSDEIPETAHVCNVLATKKNTDCNSRVPPTEQQVLSSYKQEHNEREERARNQEMPGTLEAHFVHICEAVASLDEKTRRDAMRIFQETRSLLVSTTAALGSGSVEQTVRLWSVCILYCASRLSLDPCEAPQCKLSHILGIADVSIWDFFRELPQFLQKADFILEAVYGDARDRLRQVKDLQASFVHLAVLFNFYKRNYCSYFLSSDTTKTSDLSTADCASNHLHFGWMLFLALRSHVLTQFDLVTCTNGLIAVLAIMIIHMPVHLRKISYNAVRSSAGVNVVASLCTAHYASEEDVHLMVEKASDMIKEILSMVHVLQSPKHLQQLSDIDTERLTYFEGLLEEHSVPSYLEILNKNYEEVFKERGELDERVFLHGDDAIVGMISDGGPALDEIPHFTGAKRKHEVMMSPMKPLTSKASVVSPASSPWPSPSKASCTKMLPPTPITSTMMSAKWIRTVIAPLSTEPSPDLLHFLRSCDMDLTQEVKTRAQVLLGAILSSERPATWRVVGGVDSIWAEQRRSEALKLYYRVLGCMCRAESQRLHCDNLSALLINERFHRCMLACSAELVLAAYKTLSLNFPAVLEPMGITPFDVWKVIESFVRHEETLPRELKRHLNSLEEKILEKLAWEKSSSMYNSLIVAKPHLQSEIYTLALLAEPMQSLDTFLSCYQTSDGNAQTLMPNPRAELPLSDKQGPLSPSTKASVSSAVNPLALGSADKARSELPCPVQERSSAFSTFSVVKPRMQPYLQSAFASPQRPSPVGGGETCAETVVNVFFQKVLKLAAIRIKFLCESIKLSNSVMEDVYKTVHHILHNETGLFFKRHIDQIILCSLYGVCKVKQLNVTFKQIIHHYKQNPHDSYIFRTVLFNLPSARPSGKGGQGSGDIISFYNAIFVPIIKGFLMQLNNRATAATHATEDGEKPDSQVPGSPGPSPFSSLPDMSPKKISANHNVYVSPLKSSKIDSLRSPHARSLYACVGESTHAYQSPSKDLTDINNRVNSRRLGRIDFGDTGLVSDSLVAGSLYPCNMNLKTNHLKSDSALS